MRTQVLKYVHTYICIYVHKCAINGRMHVFEQLDKLDA